MPFQPTQSGNPKGRPRGSSNKASSDLRKAVLELLDNNWDSIQTDLKRVTARDRLNFIEKLLGYALPKLQSVEVSAELTSRIEGLSDDQLNRLIDKILNEEAS
ncbi:hypothetical protein GCM10027275_16660 [Rhabdobacter roseus]|uniref:DUF5681 domain-containing protein n=1 Tax=Rhabdobacter roseus TaxID=1655419 RepID=A0A840TU68_9BACT|nr:hypothetical protein [Rhabdobacter roseus]